MQQLLTLEMALWSGTIVLTIVSLALIVRYYRKKVDAAFLEGVQEGYRANVEWHRHDAVRSYQMEVARKMHDAGREHVARPGTHPARVHKARIGPIRPSVNRTPE